MPEVVLPLTVRDLTVADLPACAWAGSGVATSLERARLGEVDYLAVCPPSGLPVALGGVDYTLTSGAGTLWQLSVHESLRSCGIGTILVQAAEQRIRARGLNGLSWAWTKNTRGRALFMSGSGTSRTAASPAHGIRMPRTAPSPVTRR
jgi:GNAT superfamily N-acetyltransferase